jgi:hypothetical protein
MIWAAYNSRLSLATALVLVIGMVVGWVFPASLIAFRPGAVDITDGVVTLAREFPGDRFGLRRPVLSYTEIIRPLTPMHHGGHPCVQTGGPIRYVSPSPVGTWSLAWAGDCIDDPAGFHWQAAWVWHVGAIRLGPVQLETTVLQPRTDPLP